MLQGGDSETSTVGDQVTKTFSYSVTVCIAQILFLVQFSHILGRYRFCTTEVLKLNFNTFYTCDKMYQKPHKISLYDDIRIDNPALQLHFIMCPFPNQIQFGLGKNHQIIDQLFQTKSSLVWKIIVSNVEGN